MRAPEFWGSPPGLASGLLAPFEAAWQAAGRLRRAVSSPYRAPVSVVCVGNLVAGGSGKTPVVLSLAAMAARAGIAAHIVTRGYGGRFSGPLQVDPAKHDAIMVGDEALLLAARAPCWVARNRAAGISAAAEAGADIVLLDDGFQNPSIEKDLSLVVVDADYGFGNGRMIPAGPLREPTDSGLGRADAVVLLGDGAMLTRLRGLPCPVLCGCLEPVQGERFAAVRVVAFAGIGRPAKFFASLRAAGADLAATHPFPDHHRYAARELARLRREAAETSARLVTTAKDWIRLPPLSREGIDVLEVEIRWRDAGVAAGLLSGALCRAPEEDAHGNRRTAARG